jgi:hypothetical protein
MDKEELIDRIKSALILLTEGNSFKVGDLTFGCKDKNILSVTGWTTTNYLETLTKQKALTEFYEIKSLFARMVNASIELSEFIKYKQINYYLGYDDNGKCGIGICNEIDGQINWETTLNE